MFIHGDVAFRPVERQDLEILRRLRNEASTFLQLTDVRMVTPAMQESWFERISAATGKAYFSVFKVDREFPVMVIDKLVGVIRFDEIDHANRSVRVGCDILPSERGKGLGTAAFNALMKYCFDHWNMNRLWLCVLDNNAVAKKVYKNAGFKDEGRMRKAIWRDGMYRDYIVMSILKDEYYR